MSSEGTIFDTQIMKRSSKKENFKELYLKEKEKNDILEKEKRNILEQGNKYVYSDATGNIGEKDEQKQLFRLNYYNETKQFDKLVAIFGNQACEGINILKLDSDELMDFDHLTKAPACFKSDWRIQMRKTKCIYKISVKSENGAKPTIINHTSRCAKVFQPEGELYQFREDLDTISCEYKDKRKKGEIGEDVKISNLDCLKNGEKPRISMKKTLHFFVFEGTGKGESFCKPNSMAVCNKKEGIKFIICDDEEKQKKYIDSIFDELTLSFRDKGMPSKNSDKSKHDCCRVWAYEDIKTDGSIKLKGSLHVRM